MGDAEKSKPVKQFAAPGRARKALANPPNPPHRPLIRFPPCVTVFFS